MSIPGDDATGGGPTKPKKRKSGTPTGNAGEYFVMGELLRRGFDAQLADRNTQGYDLLVGRSKEPTLRKVQVKTVRAQPWYVSTADFDGELLDRVTMKPVRFFIAKNWDLDWPLSNMKIDGTL